ncbi:MAG: TIGR03364 family FAD-dependent oxidoreductase [Alphaproteobacteria bacterium]|nr:TIGR03364 family FAD-dependent oxidoreductase [Alphaproteobacteria bacterium]MBL6937024.1 TIGR03364 family FAD-dependent oxidoreductase [Alphaproteobacteria bacterium]MBL7097793.1 TIGR03364 family FAD-dependent oxidoreductase [Alphaproteobacteria bacterium]
MSGHFDLAVVGAGVVGLAHAYAAARLGKRVVVIDRDSRANGASIRNFGFVTVTGQKSGDNWRRARRSRDVWAEIAPQAGIAIEQHGLLLALRHPESVAVAEAFLKTSMGDGCALRSSSEFTEAFPGAVGNLGALWSPHDLRVESRDALPRLAAWLTGRLGVTFLWRTAVHAVVPPAIETSRGRIEAEAAIVCPGDDLFTLFPHRVAAYNVTRCRLSMLRLADPGFRMPAPVMSDLGLLRYAGYGDLPEAQALRRRLEAEQPAHLRNGVHLIAVQSADGSLVVGDSHHYDDTPPPFAPVEVDAMILDELRAATGMTPPAVLERWTGTYSSCTDRAMFVDAPSDAVRLVMVTGGNGASTAFAIGEEVIGALYGCKVGGDA